MDTINVNKSTIIKPYSIYYSRFPIFGKTSNFYAPVTLGIGNGSFPNSAHASFNSSSAFNSK